MNLYTVVTGEIREGDVSRWIDKTLVSVNAHWIGKDASEVDFIVLRPVKVPSRDETKECFLIFEDHEPVKLVDSMQKFYKHDSHGKTKTWLIFDLE